MMIEQYLKGKIKDKVKMQQLVDARFDPVKREGSGEAAIEDTDQVADDGQ
jgi:hypothetical protein